MDKCPCINELIGATKYNTDDTTSIVCQYLYTRFIYSRVFLILIFLFRLNSRTSEDHEFISQAMFNLLHLFKLEDKHPFNVVTTPPKLNPKMYPSRQLCDTVCCGNTNTGLVSV